MHIRKLAALAAGTVVIAAACSSSAATIAPTQAPASVAPASQAPASEAPASAAPSAIACTYAKPVRVQLQWVPQAQFAGYYAAQKNGYWTDDGLQVEIVPGSPDIVPQQVGSAPDGPEFTTSWLPKVLEAREKGGSDLVNIAQLYQRSGTLSVSWKDSNITSPADFKGKKIGVWDFGNEFEVTAAAKKAGLEQGTDYEKVIQPFDMSLLLNEQIDAAEAMTYNEYAQVLEATNPATGALYQPGDLNVIDYNAVGTAMLQDGVFARAGWLAADPCNVEAAVKFLKGTFKGWAFCRDNPGECVDDVLAAGTALGKGHQTWQMNEVNPLIWPSPGGIGVMDTALYDQTVAVATGGGVITAPPPADAIRTDLAQRALLELGPDFDAKGTSFQKGTVTVTAGGE
jgi:NitT/TauT family transport system substrate-binding protein